MALPTYAGCSWFQPLHWLFMTQPTKGAIAIVLLGAIAGCSGPGGDGGAAADPFDVYEDVLEFRDVSWRSADAP